MNIVVFTGAGVSADSGISTFRDSDGLWENYRIEDVCTPEALHTNRNLVIDFYNARRKDLLQREPNAAHIAIAALQEKHDVTVITQNVDDLHEQAGSRRIVHLHGELSKLRSSTNPDNIYLIKGWRKDPNAWEQKYDTKDEYGALLRPHIVFFGEQVPRLEEAIEIAAHAEVFIVVGSSLVVYPAASLIQYINQNIPVYVIDPNIPELPYVSNPITRIAQRAAVGMPKVAEELMS
ncbi:MAG: NAD-dependent deacylase [Bacteroidales bacterium]|jgi:NAD-dependent deacetylase|nr:NAD-dependent deacylase [Bacteroidales bacterium]